MALIKVENNLTVGQTPTFLTSNISAGTNVVPVKNLNNFTLSWAVQIGNTGEATTEISLLSSATPSGTLGTLTANITQDHPTDTPIFPIKYDKVVFMRSTTGTAGIATQIANGTISIQPQGTTTFFDDTTSASGYAYQTYFYNSVTAGSSSISSWITTSGFPFYSLGKLRQRVKDKLVSAGYINGINIDDTMITDWFNEWLEQMQSKAIDVNEDYNLGTFQIAYTGTQELGTVTQTDFRGGFKRVWYVDGSGTFTATKMDSNSFSPNKTFTTTYPYFYMQGDSVVGRKPSDATGTLIFEYPVLNTIMTNDSDTLPITMQGYTKSFIDYAHSQALFKDQKIEEANAKLGEAMNGLATFMKELTPRQKTGATFVDIVEDTAADQELWL